MSEVCVLYHSGRGHTESQAQAVARGARSVGSDAYVIAVEQAQESWEVMQRSDALVFGAPTYLGSLSAPFKAFMDSTSPIWYEQRWKDKIAAGFTNSSCQSGDKLSSLIQLALFAAQHGMVWVGLGIHGGNNASTGSIEDPNRLGSWLGAMAQSNYDQKADVAPPPTDLRTAELLGARVAELSGRWRGGDRLASG